MPQPPCSVKPKTWRSCDHTPTYGGGFRQGREAGKGMIGYPEHRTPQLVEGMAQRTRTSSGLRKFPAEDDRPGVAVTTPLPTAGTFSSVAEDPD